MNILTYDIEDWFHLLDVPGVESARSWDKFESRISENVDTLLEITLKHGHSATFFCLGWVAERYPDIIRRIDSYGFEIASHSHLHSLVYKQNPSEFKAETLRSIRTIEDVIGKRVRGYRAPGFSITPSENWAFDVLSEIGVEYDCSVFPASRGHGGFSSFGYGIPTVIETGSGVLREFPISLARFCGRRIVFSGGGYFRLLPYTVVQALTKRAGYTMTYFHPRDIDPGQPVLDIGLSRRFKSYVGLSRAKDKLDRWLADNRFIDIATAEAETDWSLAPKFTTHGR